MYIRTRCFSVSGTVFFTSVFFYGVGVVSYRGFGGPRTIIPCAPSRWSGFLRLRYRLPLKAPTSAGVRDIRGLCALSPGRPLLKHVLGDSLLAGFGTCRSLLLRAGAPSPPLILEVTARAPKRGKFFQFFPQSHCRGFEILCIHFSRFW